MRVAGVAAFVIVIGAVVAFSSCESDETVAIADPLAADSGGSDAGVAGAHDAGDAGHGDAGTADAGTVDGGADGGALDGGPRACNPVEAQQPIEGYAHVDVCAHVDYVSNPPSSGNHYPVWAAYRSYTAPVPEGYWVHNLEHGTVVISYNCTGCDDQIAAAQALIDAQQDDICAPADAGGVHARMLMTPDPKLTTAFGASAWGWNLRADCFDAQAFAGFISRHYGRGREDRCDDGIALAADPGDCGK